MKLILLFISLFLFGCNNDNNIQILTTPDDLTTTIQYKQINGIDSNLLSLDIYYNSDINIPKPVIIYVHGGGWSIGDKSSQIENKINLFRSLNYILISINYRLSPYPIDISNPNRIKYPDHNVDIADALFWINNNIEQYGGNKNKMVLLGHSAGAHLVALTGTNENFLQSKGLSFSNIKGVAVIDTEGFDINEQIENGSNQNIYINAFGTDSAQNVKASPIYNIINTISYPKFFIAKRGNSQRIGYANDFINVLETNGVSVSQVDGSIYDHSGINNAIGAPNETLITNELKNFLLECFE
ncbi:alpha/beta hydrolase [uncultured Polaribacter sp.]|uniref:alpha/beta hydrolase n=1 Tax=uncultured Polaribacter sp. TaxID=174711 RepID=UPI002634C9F7|nr:alpha/beta hydrolase [uncultured Polaribacter sp.]